MEKRQRITGLEDLFPGKTITIGTASIVITPLNIRQISTIVKKSEGIAKALSEKGISLDNFNTPKGLVVLASYFVNEAPELLEEATNIDKDDIMRLPLDKVIELLSVVVEVNLESKDSLVKNFNSLIKIFPVENVEENQSQMEQK